MSTQKRIGRSTQSAAGKAAARRHVVGLAANGSSGLWDIAVDETISGAARWFAQLEGPGVYLYFEIESPQIIDKLIQFIERAPGTNKHLPSAATADNGSLRLGSFGRTPVALIWDDEVKDRCFFAIGTAAQPALRLTLSGGDLDAIANALRQVRDDLAHEGLG
jgi:hypothetical protein